MKKSSFEIRIWIRWKEQKKEQKNANPNQSILISRKKIKNSVLKKRVRV